MQSFDTDKQKTKARRTRDRARKRRERAVFRRAGLVEIRLVASVAQRERLFELLERENLTVLRHPKLLAASLRPRPKRGRRATGSAPVAGATQLDLFGLPLMDASGDSQPAPKPQTRPGVAIGAKVSDAPQAGGPSVAPAMDSTRRDHP